MDIALVQPIDMTDEMLLHPIDSIAPVGSYLRYDPIYDRITQARLTEDASLPQGVWQRPTQQADWQLVEELCADALQHRSKDLQIALWLTEAWLHLEGLPGYSRGCNLILGLHHHFVVALHPAPELPAGAKTDEIVLPLDAKDPAIEKRANLIQWLDEKLSLQVKLLPLTSPSTGTGVAPLSLADLEAAHHQDQLQRRLASGSTASGVGTFERSLTLTPPDSLTSMWENIQQAIAATDLLDQVFDACYGSANGGVLKLQNVLERMAIAIAPALPAQNMLETSEEDANDRSERGCDSVSSRTRLSNVPATPSRTSSHSPVMSCGCTPIQNREDAYSRLAEISEFLGKLEPHSPVPYLLQRAIAWGGMNLSELLQELLHDQVALQEVGNLLRLDR
jgi:type VI secretion system protein ImpA